MNDERLQEILSGFASLNVVVFGDLFLDQYLEVDPALEEVSIETGKPAHQIVGKRTQPGAAGTVCNNLVALGVGRVNVIAAIGEDGEGFELRQACAKRGIEATLIQSNERFTPTYTKPMRQEASDETEMERFDTKNRAPLGDEIEEQLMQALEAAVAEADAVIIADQVQERNCGVITDRMRGFLTGLGTVHEDTLFFADSRERIGEFAQVTIKPNRFECVRAVNPDAGEDPSTEDAIHAAKQLLSITGKPVFLTLDREGICVIEDDAQTILPIVPVSGPIDIVGAGDSVTAGIVSALCAGASRTEAALIGQLVSSVTVQQLGTTGTASPEQVMQAWRDNRAVYE